MTSTLLFLLIPLAASVAVFTYLRLESRTPRRWIPMVSRALAWGGLAVLLVNPACPGAATTGEPLVLLDASLSMRAAPGQWEAATDTARMLGRVRWFGDARPWTDSVSGRGQTDLGPALAAALSVGRRIVVVTDGEVDDARDLPSDQLGAAGVLVLPRARGRDLAVLRVDAPARATVGDTMAVLAEVRLDDADSAETVTVEVRLGGRRIGRGSVRVEPGATVPLRLQVGTRGLPAGRQFLEVGIAGANDVEPRDDARLVAVAFSATPGIVMLARPGDWDARFLYRTLGDVAGLPVKGFVQLEGNQWRAMDGLHEVSAETVGRAARGADLLVVRGDAPELVRTTRARALLHWPRAGVVAGEWYASGASVSPVALAFLGVPPDSLPPATGARAQEPGNGDWVGMSVQLGRRGAARAVWIGHQDGAHRQITVSADGLWRWVFRGGPSADVYRALVAASVSWLLAVPDRGAAEAQLLHPVVDQGMPVAFVRSVDSISVLPITFEHGGERQQDTLRFAGDGRASIWLPPGTYQYRLGGPRGGSGTVAVDTWSREWLSQPVTLTARGTPAIGAGAPRTARQSPWLYLLVLLALAGEWLARRRLGLR